MKRPAADSGQSELGWLHSRHTFSFRNYFDPDHMGFRALRVINDDVVEAGQGFGEQPHRDAEIFSYVIDGDVFVVGESLKTDDGVAVENIGALEFQGRDGAQFLLLDLK